MNIIHNIVGAARAWRSTKVLVCRSFGAREEEACPLVAYWAWEGVDFSFFRKPLVAYTSLPGLDVNSLVYGIDGYPYVGKPYPIPIDEERRSLLSHSIGALIRTALDRYQRERGTYAADESTCALYSARLHPHLLPTVTERHSLSMRVYRRAMKRIGNPQLYGKQLGEYVSYGGYFREIR